MIKVSTVRSAVRRTVLMKVANTYGGPSNVCSNVGRTMQPPSPVKPPAAVTPKTPRYGTPSQGTAPSVPKPSGYWGTYKARGGTFNPLKDAYNLVQSAGRDIGTGFNAARRYMAGKVRPMLGSASPATPYSKPVVPAATR